MLNVYLITAGELRRQARRRMAKGNSPPTGYIVLGEYQKKQGVRKKSCGFPVDNENI